MFTAKFIKNIIFDGRKLRAHGRIEKYYGSNEEYYGSIGK